jgi:aerobic C4-dicarboxylate transport protein
VVAVSSGEAIQPVARSAALTRPRRLLGVTRAPIRSPEPVLPRFIAKMEDVGCHESVIGLVIPTGYSFNLDGTCIYLTMAAVLLPHATNTDLTVWQQVGILLVPLLTSKRAAAVTGSGFIVLAATLGSVSHIPIASMALILGIDRFMSEARALTNVIGTAVATIVVARWEGQLDKPRMQQMLAGRAPAPNGRPKMIPATQPAADAALASHDTP